MARGPSLETSLLQLAEIRQRAVDAEDARALQRFLQRGPGPAVSAAAAIVAEQRLEDFEPMLVAAFDRLRERPVQRDPGCLGKAAIAEALHEMAAATADLYLTGVCTRQLEPVWGGQQDTAMMLRSACGRGLVSMRHPDALLYLADALADPEAPVRLSAAQSLAYHGAETGLPVLRLKVLSGDAEVQVLGECMLAMLRIGTTSSVAFVGQQLQHVAPERREVAALALGESRVEDALAFLVGWLPEARSTGQAEAALLSIAMLRSDAAMSFLLDQIANQPGPEAREALTAIGIHKRDATLRERVEEAALRAEVDLARDLEAIFQSPGGSPR